MVVVADEEVVVVAVVAGGGDVEVPRDHRSWTVRMEVGFP